MELGTWTVDYNRSLSVYVVTVSLKHSLVDLGLGQREGGAK